MDAHTFMCGVVLHIHTSMITNLCLEDVTINNVKTRFLQC